MTAAPLFSSSRLPRRRFIQGAAAAIAASALDTSSARATASGRIALGFIGSGSRARWVAELFQNNGSFDFAACADYFPARADEFGEKFGVAPARRYHGLDGYKRLLESPVDAVAIETPPYFHPEQASAAIDAGKHVYLAKPVAVDVPGCHAIAETGRRATARKLAFLVDFQTRANEHYQKAIARVHAGAIGRPTFGEARYHTGQHGPGKPVADTPENRLRYWMSDRALSGDIITEQNIHTLDVMHWIMQHPPLHAVGSGGRKVRTHFGDCWDHFSLLFQYAEGVAVVFTAKQYNDGASDAGIIVDVFGTQGRISTKYGGPVTLLGRDKEYVSGNTADIYKAAVATNVATFHRMITTGDFSNPTVAPSVESNLVSIMGRTAAYARRPVSWDETLRNTERLQPRLDGLKS